MDYEKAYKEALERAKAGKPLDEVFPELKESEDERIRNEIMEAVENWLPYERVEEIRFYLAKQIENKPAEWSEEDDACYELVLRELEENRRNQTQYTWHFNRILNWYEGRYKLLRPQPHWKPSEEQMEALYTILEHEAERIGPSKPLELANGLYDDLKKL